MRLMSALSIRRAIRVGRASDGLYRQDSDLRTATEKGRSVSDLIAIWRHNLITIWHGARHAG